ncbi:MAG: hypothetical protein LLG40_14600 [Deltaproteobacteria bacterium]|nr:hypothetical protein [Deltaproteobacteria bacterium]
MAKKEIVIRTPAWPDLKDEMPREVMEMRQKVIGKYVVWSFSFLVRLVI